LESAQDQVLRSVHVGYVVKYVYSRNPGVFIKEGIERPGRSFIASIQTMLIDNQNLHN
jgi:hypothetical protein